jgi:hypothetical protein
MGPEAILLSIRDEGGEGSYRFSCPECLNTIEKPADRKVIALLLSAGVELAEHADEARVPGEKVRSSDRRPSGPPFTVDDLITFHLLLQNEAELNQVLPRP